MIVPGSPHVKTYGLRAPNGTHRRPASCEEVQCLNFVKGFTIKLDPTTQGRLIADVRRLRAGQYVETPDQSLIRFTFPPGTPCFGTHTVSLDRPPLYVVRDFAGSRRHANARDWVDDFQDNQSRLADKIKEG